LVVRGSSVERVEAQPAIRTPAVTIAIGARECMSSVTGGKSGLPL